MASRTKGWTGSEEQWSAAKATFAADFGYRKCAEVAAAVEDQPGPAPSMGTIRRRAVLEGWIRDESVRPAMNGPALMAQGDRKDAAVLFVAQGKVAMSVRMERLADQLEQACTELVRQMFVEHEVVEVKVTGMGGGIQQVETVRTKLTEPSSKDKQALASAASMLLDRLQLITGGATSRTELGPIADRAQAEARLRMVRDELAERRTVAEATVRATKAAGETG